MEDAVTRQEHREFALRMESEHKRLTEEDQRQNHRINELEENVKEIHKLTVSMERMSANMQSMLEAIERQGNLIEKQNDRIGRIEEEPAEDYKQIKMLIITTFIASIIGGVVSQIASLL